MKVDYEAWARRMGMKPVFKGTVEGKINGNKFEAEILIADSGTTIRVDSDQAPPTNDGKNVVYRTGFLVKTDVEWIGRWHDYDPSEMSMLTLHGAQQYRINDCRHLAEEFVLATAQQGFYEHGTNHPIQTLH